MTNEVAVRSDINNSLQEVQSNQRLCHMLMQTPHFRRIGEEGMFAIVMKAKSLGISPIEALNGGLYYVQGKVGMSTEMMATLIRQSGHSVVKDEKSSNNICILHGKRKDNGDTWTVSFSMEDAKRAGLAKNMYEKYPGIMLYNRAMSMLARQLFPDIIKGAGYTMEELQEIKVNSVQRMEQPQVIEAPYEEKKKAPSISDEEAQFLYDHFMLCADDFKSRVLQWIGVKSDKEFIEGVKNKPMIQFDSFLDRLKEASTHYQMSLKSKDEAPQVILETEKVENVG